MQPTVTKANTPPPPPSVYNSKTVPQADHFKKTLGFSFFLGGEQKETIKPNKPTHKCIYIYICFPYKLMLFQPHAINISQNR